MLLDICDSRSFRRPYNGEVSTYFVQNFGCRATQADGAALERQLLDRGLARAGTAGEAEVVVLNTCTVTASADQDVRAAIRRIQRENPASKILVTGCYAQRAPEEIAALPGVSLVVGNSHKHRLAQIVAGALDLSKTAEPASPSAGDSRGHSAIRVAQNDSTPDREFAPEGAAFIPLTTLTASSGSREPDAGGLIFVSDIFAHTELLAAPVFDAANERTRPNLKVQDGCDQRCSFCVIPYVRGQSRSLQADRILREVAGLVESGYREVVISGINLGRWGRDLDGFGASLSDANDVVGKPKAGSRKPTLDSLIRAILSATALEKLRIS